MITNKWSVLINIEPSCQDVKFKQWKQVKEKNKSKDEWKAKFKPNKKISTADRNTRAKKEQRTNLQTELLYFATFIKKNIAIFQNPWLKSDSKTNLLGPTTSFTASQISNITFDLICEISPSNLDKSRLCRQRCFVVFQVNTERRHDSLEVT
jgi:hypothetical protein